MLAFLGGNASIFKIERISPPLLKRNYSLPPKSYETRLHIADLRLYVGL